MKKNKIFESILVFLSLLVLVSVGYLFQSEKITSFVLNTSQTENIIGQVIKQNGNVYIRSVQDSVWLKVNSKKNIYYQDSIVSLSKSSASLKIPAFKIEKLDLGAYTLVKFLIFRNKPLLVIDHGEVNIKIESGHSILVQKNDRIEEIKSNINDDSNNISKTEIEKENAKNNLKNELFPRPNNIILLHHSKGFVNILPAEVCLSDFCYLSISSNNNIKKDSIYKKNEIPVYRLKIDSETKNQTIQYIYKDGLKSVIGQFEIAENNDQNFSAMLKAKKNIEFVEE